MPVSPAIFSLLGNVALGLFLVFTLVLYRAVKVFAGLAPANAWPRGSKNSNDPYLASRIHGRSISFFQRYSNDIAV